jgi:hypothetical protein
MAWQDSDNSGGKSRLKYSPVAGESLSADGLVPGEAAINIADGKILYKNHQGAVRSIPTGYTGTLTVYDTTLGADKLLTFSNGLLISVANP